MRLTRTFLNDFRYFTQMLIPGTCSLMYYLKEIEYLRTFTNNRAVLLKDHCIVVI